VVLARDDIIPVVGLAVSERAKIRYYYAAIRSSISLANYFHGADFFLRS
jgi:hypothetical protein